MASQLLQPSISGLVLLLKNNTSEFLNTHHVAVQAEILQTVSKCLTPYETRHLSSITKNKNKRCNVFITVSEKLSRNLTWPPLPYTVSG